MYAVIKTGGKQYRVEEGQRLDVERLAGDEVELTPVLVVDGDTVLATPDQLAKAKVSRPRGRRGQGPQDQRLHLQEQEQRASPLGSSPALRHHRDHQDLAGRQRPRRRPAKAAASSEKDD